MIYEFQKTYINDPNDAVTAGTGSGIHLAKDVTFNLGFFDRQNSKLKTVTDLNDSPYFSGATIDILDAAGVIVSGDYASGIISPSFVFSEDRNIDVFGSYTKDFGIKVTSTDLTTDTQTTGILQVYGNYAEINNLFVTDGDAHRYYDSGSGGYSGLETGSNTTTGKIQVDLTFSGNPQYTKYDRVDVYYSTGSGVSLDVSGFYKSFNTFEQKRDFSFNITLDKLAANTPYYFSLIPHSAIGSGAPWMIGPHTLAQVPSSGLVIDCSEINLNEGESTANMDLQTGVITDVYSFVHILSTGDFSSVEYHIQISDAQDLCSTHKFIITHTGTGVTDYSCSEYAISDNSHLELDVTSGLLARVTDASYSPAEYKMFKISM